MAKELKTTVSLNGKIAASLRQAFKFAQTETGKTASKMTHLGKVGSSLNSSLVALGGTVAAVFSAQKIFDTADAWMTVRARVGLVTDGIQQQKESLDGLYAIAQKTRQSYEATGDLYSKIAMNAERLNMANSDALKLTETVNKALRVGGGGAAQNEAAILQFSQALASGRLQGDELRSLLENAPRLTKAIAEGLGVATGSLKEMGKEGILTSELIIEALQSQAGVIDEEFTRMPLTIRGALTYASNAFGKFVDSSGENSKIFTKLAQGIIWSTDTLFASLISIGESKAFAALTDSVVAFFQEAGPKVKAFGSFIDENWSTIKPIIEGITISLVALKAGLAIQGLINAAAFSWKIYKATTQGATIAQWALNFAMSANPIGLIAIGIAAAIVAIYYLYKNWDKVTKFFGDKIEWLKEKFDSFAKWLADIGDKIGDFLNSINPFQETKVEVVANGKVAKFATGGFANRPSIFGEAGLEAAIPIKPKNPRSIALLNKTAQMLGVSSGNGGGININYAPQIYGGNASEIKQILSDERQKFESWANDFFGEQRRVGFSG